MTQAAWILWEVLLNWVNHVTKTPVDYQLFARALACVDVHERAYMCAFMRVPNCARQYDGYANTHLKRGENRRVLSYRVVA